LNRKKRELTQIENDYEIEVTVKGKTSYLLNQVELETVKREKPRAEDVARSEAESDEAPVPVPRFETVSTEDSDPGLAEEGSGPADSGKKRKRRRKKKKVGADTAVISQQSEFAAPVEDQVAEQAHVQEPDGGEEHGLSADELASKPKKRRRRRGRKGAKSADEAVMNESAPAFTLLAESAPAVTVASDESQRKPELEADSVQKKPKRTKTPRAKKTVVTSPVQAESTAVEPVVEVAVAPIKPRRPAARKTIKAVPEVVEVPAAPPQRVVRPRSPKKIAEIQ
jgi:ribonuclease E